MDSDAPMYDVSNDKARLNFGWVVRALRGTYWAGRRTEETIRKSIDASLCYGVYRAGTGEQVGFARVVTDQATFAWLCDVMVDPAHRGVGVGKKLVSAVLADPRLAAVTFLLGTRDAHGLYERYGFARHEVMRRAAPAPQA